MPHAYDMVLCDSYAVTRAVPASRFLLYIAFTVMEFWVCLCCSVFHFMNSAYHTTMNFAYLSALCVSTFCSELTYPWQNARHETDVASSCNMSTPQYCSNCAALLCTPYSKLHHVTCDSYVTVLRAGVCECCVSVQKQLFWLLSAKLTSLSVNASLSGNLGRGGL